MRMNARNEKYTSTVLQHLQIRHRVREKVDEIIIVKSSRDLDTNISTSINFNINEVL